MTFASRLPVPAVAAASCARATQTAMAQPAATWRLARVGIEDGETVLHWRLARNCSISPQQAAMAYGLGCLLAMAVAAGFAVAGAPYVVIFSGIELLALGAAWLVWAGRVDDGDDVALRGDALVVTHRQGAHRETARFARAWTRARAVDGGVELLSGARRIVVGRLARGACRDAFLHDLRRALAVPAPLTHS